MSIRVMSLVWDNFPRGGSDKLAMLALADWCNDQGGSLHPSVATVAKKINLTEKQARVILHKLISEGWLAVIGNEFGGNPGQSRQYKLNVEMLTTPPVEVTPPAKVTPPVEVRDPSRGGSFTPPAHGSLTISYPPIEPPIKNSAPKKPARFDPCNLDLPEGLGFSKWSEWVAYRLKAGKPLKPESWVKQVEFIGECIAKGIDPAAMIGNSIRNGYTGLFEPKQQQATTQFLTPHQQREANNRKSTAAFLADDSDPFTINGECSHA